MASIRGYRESDGESVENEQTFFDFAAYVGLTKHLGGVTATDELLELCHDRCLSRRRK